MQTGMVTLDQFIPPVEAISNAVCYVFAKKASFTGKTIHSGDSEM